MTIRRRPLILGALGLPGFAGAQSAPRLFALVVGIDSYPFLRPLRGCVNDARGIEAAVRPLAFRLTVLLNEAASRGAFLRAWDEMASAARAGDTILITFSGHGGQEPEHVRGNEADGLDENLIFYAFQPRRQPNNAERIIDDELGARFAQTGRRGIRSIFLADSCHAGTLTRGIDPRVEVLGNRSAGMQTIENDMLAGLATAPAEIAGQPNLLFIAAGQENQLVPEVLIDGVPHGATSHAFAQVFFRGVQAGRFPSSEAFAREVVAGTRARVDGRHHPLAENQLPAAEPLLPLNGPLRPAAPQGASRPLRLHVLAGGGGLADAARALPGVMLQAEARDADAVLDPRQRELLSGLGDVLAVALTPEALAGAMEKLVALRLVLARNWLTIDVGLVPRGAPLSAGGANSRDERHGVGSEWDLVVRPPSPMALVVVSLAADGGVRLLSTAAQAARLGSAEYRLGVRVTPPPGAAHVLALGLASPQPEVLQGLVGLDRTRAPLAVARAMLAAPASAALASFGFFSA